MRSRPTDLESLPLDQSSLCSYFMVVHMVGLKVLKNKLSEYVRLAAQGETVLVTNHDTVVAEIVPPSPGRSALLADAMLADAYRKGPITPAANSSEAIPSADPVMTFEDLMRDLEESREDR